MADCLADLILRPGINPPVQIGLTLVAGVDTLAGGDEPGEIDGHPVPADLVRELAHALGLLPRPDQTEENEGPEADQAEAEDRDRDEVAEDQDEDQAEDEVAEPADPEAAPAPRAGRAAATAALADLLNLRSVAGTALTHLPRIAIVEELSGQLLALTDAAGIRRAATCGHPSCRTGRRPCTHPPQGGGLGPPPTTGRYRPTDPLDRFTRARDRRCRFPGCRAAAIRCDLHHATRWPDGDTSEANLCCLCRHHHRLIHQAPGWTMTVLPDGGLRWTTPGGQSITTHPPRYGTDDDLPPPRPSPGSRGEQVCETSPVEPPLTARERVLGRPLSPGAADDDRPAF
jgi:hypothetical protein